MLHKAGSLILALFVVAVVGAWRMVEPPSVHYETAIGILNTWNTGEPECIYNCTRSYCEEDEHLLIPIPDPWEEPATHEGYHAEWDCVEGSCEDHECFETQDDAQSLEASLQSMPVDELAAVMRLDDRVRVNAIRRSVQVHGCGDLVVLNIPLPGATIEGLVATQAD